jgi:AcrR family transcriptional regulator
MPKVNAAHRSNRRRQILHAAFCCFARRGFHETSMRDICREAKLSPGAVYLYFKSKERIVESLAEAGRLETSEWIDGCKGKNLADIVGQVLEQLNRPENLPGFQLDVRLWSEALHIPRIAALFRKSEATLMDALSQVVMTTAPKCTRKQAQAIARLLVSAIAGFELQKVMNPKADLGPAVALLTAALQAI